MRRILVCPTAFKGTLTADEASRAMARGARSGLPDAEVIRRPLSDGGPGLLDAMRFAGGRVDDAPDAGEGHAGDPAPDADADAAGGADDAGGRGAAPRRQRLEEVTVPGLLGDPVRARVLWTPAPGGEVATIESADACGLALVPRRRRDPLRADSRGVGDLIRHAGERGALEIRVGLGGSGTVDGGAGAARAFGWRFLDAEGCDLPPGGGALGRLARIETGRRPERRLVALCDVDHPLVGPRGAARTFAPQKGADPDDVRRLEEGLERLAARLGAQFGIEVGPLPGGGAAGGLGAGLAAFLGAELVSGADRMLEALGFDHLLEDADAVVTGEGAFDRTSLEGKIVGKVCRRARARNVPVLLVCGRLETPPPGGVRACGPVGTEPAAGARFVSADDLAHRTASCLQEFAASR